MLLSTASGNSFGSTGHGLSCIFAIRRISVHIGTKSSRMCLCATWRYTFIPEGASEFKHVIQARNTTLTHVCSETSNSFGDTFPFKSFSRPRTQTHGLWSTVPTDSSLLEGRSADEEWWSGGITIASEDDGR